ncbi:N-acetyllactosaminide beta-1,3-N-acetylglucosaminyltransferase 2-like [Anguilla anguilla]|uniref:N-acetyllactosaminide beta-1,3-N-acetylglucosaminyltransferase 2-like n=1 Tax=Anguilla anguilla TaxID=7936 RepID=UPI0015B363F1|nr:N-acetyllactosaminide beta-1,3-N-acetylglucosaminyltransferase 2-like [Anguilla anguilla]
MKCCSSTVAASVCKYRIALLQTAGPRPFSRLPAPCSFPVRAMLLRRFRRNSVIASFVFTCSLALVCILFSLKEEHSSLEPETVEAAKAKREIELETNSIPKVHTAVHTAIHTAVHTAVHTAAPREKNNVTWPKPRAHLKLVGISEAFRKAVPQNNAYWNRKQYALFRRLDSAARSGGSWPEAEEADRTPCSLLSSELLHINIPDFDSYPAMYQDFARGMHCRDPPILIDQPYKCPEAGGEGQPFLLFAIKSLPRNFEQRQAVRNTWGREVTFDGGLKVRTVFLLGTSSPTDPDLGQLVRFEAGHFGDVLQWNFVDTFFNLTLKENAFLGWAQRRCPHASFIFKGDDDVFVNPQAMVKYLLSLKPEEASKLYAGQIVSNATPFRDSKSKYYIPNSFYDGSYPSYAGGGGFLFSGSLVRPLYNLSQHIVFFPIDDVYTGMCFQALGITPMAHPGFRTFDIQEQDRNNVCAHKDILLVHKRTPQQVLRLWRYMFSPLLTC